MTAEHDDYDKKPNWRDIDRKKDSSKHTTDELFDLLRPLDNVKTLQQLPLLLVYGHRDSVAPPEHAQAMCRAAPHANFVESKKASHVMLTLTPQINSQIAAWLKKLLTQTR